MDDDRMSQLEEKVRTLETRLEELDKETIKIVGEYNASNVPVTINGIRRKIAHTAP